VRLDTVHPEDDQPEANQIGDAMGPHLADALLVVTGVRSETTQRPCQQLRVPREMLSHSLQQLHQNGITVATVRGLEGGIAATGLAMEPGQPPVSEPKPPRRRRKQR
jgi:hypothetical protein